MEIGNLLVFIHVTLSKTSCFISILNFAFFGFLDFNGYSFMGYAYWHIFANNWKGNIDSESSIINFSKEHLRISMTVLCVESISATNLHLCHTRETFAEHVLAVGDD